MILIVSVTENQGFGAETVLEELLRGWEDPAKALAIIAPRGSRIARVALELGIPATTPKMRDSLFSSLPAILSSSLKLPGIDIVHGWTARTWEAAYLLSLIKRARFCCTLHDHPRVADEKARRHSLMRILANRCRRLVCVSDALRRECAGEGYRCEMSVVANGLRDKRTGRSKGTGAVRIGFLGMRSNSRGFPIVQGWIDASAGENVEWHLYGNPGEEVRKAAEQTVARHSGRVFLHGHAATGSIFGNIDVLVHASTRFDSLPTVLIEAAMHGIPALAADWGGAGQVIEDGVSGCLFSTGKAADGLRSLIGLVRDASRRERMGLSARRRYLEMFTIERMVRQYRELWAAEAGRRQ